jgi:hypothetical protein
MRSALANRGIGLVAGVLGGVIASRVVDRVWRTVVGAEAPEATDTERSLVEVLAAAALQGALFAMVRAATERGGAAGVRRVNGTDPQRP